MVLEERNDRIKAFYYRLPFGDGKATLDGAVTDMMFDGRRTQVTGHVTADIVCIVGNSGEAFVECLGRLSTLGWILLLWLGGKPSSNQSSQR